MALNDKKITGYATSISALPNKVENSATWLKEQFDGRTNAEVKDSINGIVDELLAPTAAGQIGVNVPTGLTAQPNMQSVVDGLNTKITEEVYLTGAADMTRFIYDTNNDGKVNSADVADNALLLDGLSKADFAKADEAMPKLGGQFTGVAKANETATAETCLRNSEIRITNTEGEMQVTGKIIFVRK